MNARLIVLVAAGGSAALLIGALGFQYIGGLVPCKLCYWQRYPHAAAVAVGALYLLWAFRPLILAGALAALTTAGIGVYHAGVEQGWWPGPDTCSAQPVTGLTPEELLDQILAAPVVRCDDIPWALFGVSMAGWNALASFALAAVWLAAWGAAQASSSASQ